MQASERAVQASERSVQASDRAEWPITNASISRYSESQCAAVVAAVADVAIGKKIVNVTDLADDRSVCANLNEDKVPWSVLCHDSLIGKLIVSGSKSAEKRIFL